MASGGNAAQAVLPAVCEDQCDGLRETLTGVVRCVALTIGPRNLKAVGDIPGTVLFDNGREFVVHCSNPFIKLLGVRAPQQVYRKMSPWSTCLTRVRAAWRYCGGDGVGQPHLRTKAEGVKDPAALCAGPGAICALARAICWSKSCCYTWRRWHRRRDVLTGQLCHANGFGGTGLAAPALMGGHEHAAQSAQRAREPATQGDATAANTYGPLIGRLSAAARCALDAEALCV